MRELLFGMGPHRRGERGTALRERLGEVLTEALAMPVGVTVLRSYGELLRAVGTNQVQVAWLPPAVFVHAQDRFGVHLAAAAVRRGVTTYRGALFVRPKSTVRSAHDLAGRAVAWVDPDSCAGYLYPRLALRNVGVDPDHQLGAQSFLGSHGAVVRAVADGSSDVGATFVHADDGVVHDGAWHLAGLHMREVLITEPIPSDTACTVSGLTDALRERITKALLSMQDSDAGREVLEGLFDATYFAVADPNSYDTVRRAMHSRG